MIAVRAVDMAVFVVRVVMVVVMRAVGAMDVGLLGHCGHS